MVKYNNFIKNCKTIEKYYNNLIDLTKDHVFVGSTNEWIIDNYYIIAEMKSVFKKIAKENKRLNKELGKNEELYGSITNLYKDNNFSVNYKLLINKLREYQSDESKYLSYPSINIIPVIIPFILIERLTELCIHKKFAQSNKQRARDLVKSLEEKLKNGEKVDLAEYIKIDDEMLENLEYIEQLNESLKVLGEDANEIFSQLDVFLEKHNLDLKTIINKEHEESINNNILVSNIFNSLRVAIKIQPTILYDKISQTEQVLKEDLTYPKMTTETKDLYRSTIVKRTKKKSEYQYILELAEKSDDENKHIGFYLQEKENLKLRSATYISSIVILTLICSYFLSSFVLDYKWVAFILLLIPISELLIQLINKILLKFFPCRPLPKIDFSKGIDSYNATVVVMPTIIKNKTKIKEMFLLLEKYYLANKSDNLSFTLLGDCAQADTKEVENDKELSEYGIKMSEELNKKYNKRIFAFAYRKRLFNSGEGKFLGYERKRGALIHFNKLLLGKMTDKDKTKYFHGENVSLIKSDIKYVLTIDVDTELVLNNVLLLVGTMAHPLNKPVLNKDKTKVINGYGLIQPRISINIESTNKSIYSQLVAGIGGFDVYSSVIPNFYQDVFKEGSFVGKGIYDLKIFETILSNAFPENLILSHDLLEGNYLRCGFASDIELIDDFPSEFLVESTRQHRWTRGDVQITGWLKNKVRTNTEKKARNPLNLIEKFKIFDNLRRALLNPCYLLLIILSLLWGNPLVTIGIILLVIFLPMLFYIKDLLQSQNKKVFAAKYYNNLMFGFASILYRLLITFITIPYYSYLYLDAFVKATYRMLISHKNLLNWITAEDASKTVKRDMKSYFYAFKINYFAAVILVILAISFRSEYLILFIVVALSFASAPFALCIVSKEKSVKRDVLNTNSKEVIKDMAFHTWKYFDLLLTEENNYLIPDNYQENREIPADHKSSPTDIGMSLNAVIAAYELDFIDLEKAIFLLEKIITTIEKLEKWNGHLYNWYNIKTLKKMPIFIASSVDSSNLAAALIVVKEFLNINGEMELYVRSLNLFDQMDFSKFYTEQDVFSILYNTTEETLSTYQYNKFASESRILSFIAIMKGDVPSKHWLCLDKTLTQYKKHKGLVSWSGTSFEYFMPLIFMKSYPNTLLDESYFFARYCQKSYVSEIDNSLPWGISESAYDELDDGLNYKYKAFSTPYLKVIDSKENRLVLSPYSSVLAITEAPLEVYQNLQKFKKLDMYGDLGFYEAYDYTTSNKVLAYYAHHQGMILSSMANYLKDNVIQEYFHSDLRVQAFEILLKEKVQLNPTIDLKMVGYKKYDYEREKIENDIREYNLLSETPQLSILSNSEYSLLINDRGNGFSRYNTTQLNRYRKITEQDYGTYLYIKDIDSKKVWSNTYAPTNVEPDKYNVVFANDRIKFTRTDGPLVTHTEIAVTKRHNAEIRKFTFKNNSDELKKLELTTYTEVILGENSDDVNHRTFKNLFIDSSFDEETKSLIMCRRNNSKKSNAYMVGTLICKDDAVITYETERSKFIGRGNNTYNAALINEELKNGVGNNIDPIMALRMTVSIKPKSEVTVYYVSGFSKSYDGILDIVKSYNTPKELENAFEYATIASGLNIKLLGIDGKDIRSYNTMLNYLYQTSRHFVNDERKKLLTSNALSQSGLWKFDISGDRPIVLVDVCDSKSYLLAKDMIRAFQYFKSKAIFLDLIIINSESSEYKNITKREVEQEIYRMNKLFDFNKIPGAIYMLDADEITKEERILLNTVARLSFNTKDDASLEDSIKRMNLENSLVNFEKLEYDKPELIKMDTSKLDKYNGFGGFTNNGREYLVNNPNTPVPWSNVLANKNFGSIVTNNECGFTYAYNSQMFKLTSWTNDIVVNDKSEGIKVDGKEVPSGLAKHGFGYSIFSHNTKNYALETTQFVAENDTIKFYKIKMTNNTLTKRKFKVTFWLNPTLGPNEEKSSRYILSEHLREFNSVFMRNVYNVDYSNVSMFMTSSLPLKNVSIEKIISKSIDVEVEIEGYASKEFSFMLGTSIGLGSAKDLIEKYNSDEKIKNEYKRVVDNWNDKLTTIKVNTPDDSFNFAMNGWFLYQSLAARLYARAGFYQVGGAFGFRDQLQDAMNICEIDPELTRNQIIKNAAHQFIEGDVLHWWHDDNSLGLRSRYKDDYLWLVYAVSRYIKVTGDVSILDYKVNFVEGDSLLPNEEEKGIIFRQSSKSVSILEHCKIAIARSLDHIGENGLPLMGGGDWNDGMNKVGIEGKGTSVWLGFFLYSVLSEHMNILEEYRIKFDKKKYDKVLKDLMNSLNTTAWDKEYYIRAFFDNGETLGSSQNDECKIDLISQSFSILSGVIPDDRIGSVIKSVEDNLVDNKLKIIKLLTPPFKNSKNIPGYIMDYPKGIRENGGQYTHSTIWYIMALIKIGEYDKAYNYYQMINPINRTDTASNVNVYKTEPYVIAADIYSNEQYPGRGGWTWYTGSAAWFYRVGLTSILGFEKLGDILKINPHAPVSWKKYELEYKYLDTIYKIEVNLKSTFNNILEDGKKVSGIKLKNDKAVHTIIVNVKGR